jgi:EPS-associated MarR family transcriptional regulator
MVSNPRSRIERIKLNLVPGSTKTQQNAPAPTKVDRPMEDTHLRLLRLIEARPDLSQRDLARELGTSLGKVNYCLNALIDKGLVKVRNFRNSRNKLAYVYLLTPRGIDSKTTIAVQFLKRKMAEYEALKIEIEQLQREVGDRKPK